jgi:hypothetical protein
MAKYTTAVCIYTPLSIKFRVWFNVGQFLGKVLLKLFLQTLSGNFMDKGHMTYYDKTNKIALLLTFRGNSTDVRYILSSNSMAYVIFGTQFIRVIKKQYQIFHAFYCKSYPVEITQRTGELRREDMLCAARPGYPTWQNHCMLLHGIVCFESRWRIELCSNKSLRYIAARNYLRKYFSYK